MLSRLPLALLVASASFPLHNPDLFWHLAAGRLMWRTGAVIRFEPFALASAAPLAWNGFEWLSELLYFATWRAAGFLGLVAVKSLLAGATGWVVDRSLKKAGLSPVWRGAGLLTLAALAQRRWMAEPEALTFLLLAILHGALLERPRLTGRWIAGAGALFCVWANLHGGFVYGLGLLALHLAFHREPLPRRSAVFAVCAAAALINPYGWRVYEIPLFLLSRLGALRADNLEYLAPWRASGLVFKLYYALPLAGAAAAWLRRARRGRPVPPADLAVLACFGVWGGLAVRQLAVAAVVLVPVVFPLLSEAASEALGGGARLAGSLCAAAWIGLLSGSFRLGPPWRGLADVYPLRLCEAALEAPGGVLLPFDWAGYAVWLAAPARRVYVYGRLDVFAARLAEIAEARGRPEAWNAFLDRRGIVSVVERHVSQSLPGTLRDARTGRMIAVKRSPFAAYFPRERWSLAGWDDRGLVFARRGADKRPGYKLLDPSDLPYLETLARRGWLDRTALASELERHKGEWGPSRFDAAFAALATPK